MSRSSTFVLCMTLCCLAPARAATITVTSDSGGTGGPDCTLRDAITAANTDTATGGCVAGNGADTIELPVDATITLTEPDNDTDGPNGLPSITSEVIINGNGSTVERDGADDTPEFRIFFVAADGGLTLENLTVSNGSVESAPYSSAGGGIFNEGVLTLTDSTLSNNEGGDFGGGIFNLGTATVTNSTFSGNVASFHGSGIGNAGTLTLTHSTISGNSGAGAGGGGFWTSGGVLTLSYSTVCGNLPDQIDGIYTDGGGNLVVEECPPCTSGD
ncbi:MAG: hypothetical protein IIA33_11290, partial [Planctomycetes bacterium]|nr:hypothetical protein [Planctomycetota bacterium]